MGDKLVINLTQSVEAGMKKLCFESLLEVLMDG